MPLSLINLAGFLLADSYGASIPGVEWLLLGWLIVVGACVGSFLNVVVHRLPLGLNVAYPASRCPQCRHAIRGYDNIPVMSWLLLRGKCRDCGLPISCRYPIVEAVVALVSGMLASVDLFANWCGWSITASELNPWISWIPWWRFAGHFALAGTLLSATLMEYDRQAVPRRLF
ncbi:MAG: prepilin peptidase [Planctomycetota bacterium]